MSRQIVELADVNSGEVKLYHEVREGDKVITREQQDGYEYLKAKITDKNFIFAIYERCESYMGDIELKPQDITRIVMLATYCNYQGRIMATQRTPMSKKVMKEILRESNQARFNTFYNKIIENGIVRYDNDEQVYYMPKSYFNKGQTKIKDFGATRLFIDEIQYLFNSVKVTDFKRLGYVFKLLPYISKDYNIVCENPIEECIGLVQPLNATEVSKVLGIGKDTLSKALKELGKIKINNEYLIGWFSVGSKEQIKLIVNPNVLYSGQDNNKKELPELRTICSLFKIV